MRALIVGNLTLDLINGALRVGGPGLYGGRALSEGLGVEVYVLSYVDDVHKNLVLSTLNAYGIGVLELNSKEMPMFVIRGGKVVGFKGSSVRIANDVVESHVKTLKPDMVILAPVMRELDEGVVTVVRSCSNALLSLDLQGFVRSISNGAVRCSWSWSLEQLLPNVSVVHGNIVEYCFAEDEHLILKRIADLSTTCETLFLLSLDARGTYAVYKGEALHIPSIPVNVVDDVGAGDVLLSITTYYRALGYPVVDSTVKGVVAAALKVENAHGKWFNKETVERVAQEHVKNVRALKV